MRGSWFVLLALIASGSLSTGASGPRIRSYLRSGEPETCVDILFVGDGYQGGDLTKSGKYWKDVERYSKRLLKEPPFVWYRKRFNIRAAFVRSRDEGCDPTQEQDRVDTAFDCRFDSHGGRLLWFQDIHALRKIVAHARPVDIVFVMVNTERYGGAGSVLPPQERGGRPVPAPTFAANDTSSFMIALHELGHSLANLGDEYVDEATAPTYPLPEAGKDFENANLTLKANVDVTSFRTIRDTVKWRHFLDLPGAKMHRWAHEGGFFRPHGVLRPWKDCMMRSYGKRFCPVCCEEVAKAIFRICDQPWDDAAFHERHPLGEW